MKIQRVVLAVCAMFMTGCQNGEMETQAIETIDSEASISDASLVSKLQSGGPVFGIFARPQTAEGGSVAGKNRHTDFVFYSLESGPWDIPTLETFRQAMDASGNGPGHPITLRIPPIREDPEALNKYISEGLVAGGGGIVFPHVETAKEAELAVRSLGNRAWPMNPNGDVVSIILIEDRVGVESAEQIVSTPGVSVVIPGPGDLRRAYNGDDQAIEAAIQRVLTACKDSGVPCGITAGVEDVTERLVQGFKLIIVSDAATIEVARRFLE